MWTWVGTVLHNSAWTWGNLLVGWLAANIILIVLLFLWIIAIIRTAKDVIARSNNAGLQVVSILLVTFLTPILGLPVYFIIRPVSYKKDRIPWRESCALNLTACGNCTTLNPREYECCIACGEKLKIVCKECGKEYPQAYAYCPICGAPNIE